MAQENKRQEATNGGTTRKSNIEASRLSGVKGSRVLYACPPDQMNSSSILMKRRTRPRKLERSSFPITADPLPVCSWTRQRCKHQDCARAYLGLNGKSHLRGDGFLFSRGDWIHQRPSRLQAGCATGNRPGPPHASGSSTPCPPSPFDSPDFSTLTLHDTPRISPWPGRSNPDGHSDACASARAGLRSYVPHSSGPMTLSRECKTKPFHEKGHLRSEMAFIQSG